MQELIKEVLAIALPAIQQIIIVVVGAAITIVLKKVSEGINAWVGKERREIIDDIIWKVVNGVEQYAPELKIKGQEKYDQAVDWATDMLARRGIILTPDEMRAFIEAVVKQIDPKE